jgi:hypothetical protein
LYPLSSKITMPLKLITTIYRCGNPTQFHRGTGT